MHDNNELSTRLPSYGGRLIARRFQGMYSVTHPTDKDGAGLMALFVADDNQTEYPLVSVEPTDSSYHALWLGEYRDASAPMAVTSTIWKLPDGASKPLDDSCGNDGYSLYCLTPAYKLRAPMSRNGVLLYIYFQMEKRDKCVLLAGVSAENGRIVRGVAQTWCADKLHLSVYRGLDAPD